MEEIKKDLDIDAGKSAISKICKSLGLPARVSPRKFLINHINTAKRIDVASMRRRWTSDKWQTVVFTDESGIDNSGSQHKTVRRPRGTRFQSDYIFKHQNKTLRVNFFSYISYFGVGKISFYKSMNTDTYCDVVGPMIEDLEETFQGQDFSMIHDNARFATSQTTKAFMDDNLYSRYFIEHLPYSPDLNLIENAWSYLKKKVKDEIFVRGQPRTTDDLISIIERRWYNIELDFIRKLYDSLPDRMALVIQNEGNLTRY